MLDGIQTGAIYYDKGWRRNFVLNFRKSGKGMATAPTHARLVDEIADFLASNPTHEQILAFRPSEAVQETARELLAKSSEGTLTDEEQRELTQLEQAELLMRLVKARVYARRVL